MQRTGHATGLGDIVLRSKYRFLRREGGGLAAAVELRLPTGDENELLGAGGVQAKFLLLASNERGRFGQHLNVGYTAAEGRVGGSFAGFISAPLPDEINYSGGVEFVASPRFTLIGDLVGRTLRGAGRLDVVSKNFQYAYFTLAPDGSPAPPYAPPAGFGASPGPDCGAIPPFRTIVCHSVFLNEFNPRSGNLTLLLGTGGVKFNLAGNLLLSGSVLFPLTNAGLRSRLTTVVGLDYAF